MNLIVKCYPFYDGKSSLKW